MKYFTHLLLVVLSSCSLFHATPDKVVEGQRAVYQGLLLAEENDDIILQAYRTDNQAAVTYHYNFIYEPKIDSIRKDVVLSREAKSEQIAALEVERDKAIKEAYDLIEKNAQDLYDKSHQNLEITKKLVESIYNYMSTTPIDIDIIPFLAEKLNEVRRIPN